ncbi:MAG TPA: ATP-binding cassette domain-containing protein, partial [Steroidobacteraceae bacterium]|nr:ATP-binding cassette domain-containing protein [Steroidobacteraceae bacterium]
AELLRGVDLCVPQGQALAVVGESGAGKSTLVRALLRLAPPSAGQVLIDGQDLAILSPAELRAQRRLIQVVFQDPLASLNPALDVLTLVADPLRTRAHSRLTPAVRERVVEQLAAVGLGSEYLSRRAAGLSGGQAQRVAIARALIVEPRMLICDEPVSALDLALRAQVLQLLGELRRTRTLALLLVTHDLHAARLLCDHTLVLRRGAVVEQGATATLFARPVADYTRALLDAMLSVDPARVGSRSVS